jgi:hypothetical protein
VIHRTFRSLDEAPKLVGFTVRQWAVLIAGSSGILGVVYLTHLPTKPAITLCVFVIGLPAALTYVSESGGLQLGALIKDCLRWRLSGHHLPAATAEQARCKGVLVMAPDRDPRGEHLSGDAAHVAAGGAGLVDELVGGERWRR